MSSLPQVTRIDLTDRERTVIVKVFSVTGTLMLIRQGILPGESDANDLEFCHKHADEVMALIAKITRDKVNKDLLRMADGILSVEQHLFKTNFERIKRTAAIAKQAHPEIKSRLRDDMDWLIDELEKRI